MRHRNGLSEGLIGGGRAVKPQRLSTGQRSRWGDRARYRNAQIIYLLGRSICGIVTEFEPRKTGIHEPKQRSSLKTKYGPRRVRQEAPTLGEAIAAAQGMSDELNEQAEIAASLIGLPQEQVRTELLKLSRLRKGRDHLRGVHGPAGAAHRVSVSRAAAVIPVAVGNDRPAWSRPAFRKS